MDSHAVFATAKQPVTDCSNADTGANARSGAIVDLYPDEPLPLSFLRPQNLFCMTLYNESGADFSATLQALLIALGESVPERAGYASAPCCVFIIADGREALTPAAAGLLSSCGLVPERRPAEGCDVVFHCSVHHPSDLLAHLNVAPGAGRPRDVPIRFVTCIKPANRGKLDSHALFFGVLCRQMQPWLCHQVDVGTLLHPLAIRKMIETMRRTPNIGALASHITSPAPSAGCGLLKTWQFMDFATQLAIAWPAEVLTGHLSVLPGQYSVIRWAAMVAAVPSAEGGEVFCVLQRYLRGAAPRSKFERLMFLAEDRVIGNEIVLSPNQDWRLDYCMGARAVTDACVNMPELLRQRRRWNNSSAACRLWLLSNWPAEMTRTDRSLRRKLGFSASMLWQSLVTVQQFLAPAITVSFWAVQATALLSCPPALAIATVGCGAASWALVLWPAGTRAHGAVFAGLRDAVSLAYFVLVFASLTVGLSWQASLLLTLPSVLLACGTALALRPHAGQVLRRSAEYWSVNPVLQIVLWAYALSQLDDFSWGTKGRRRCAATDGGAKMLLSRNIVLASWVILNGGVAASCIGRAGLLFQGLNPVAEIASLLILTTTLPAALLFFARRAWRKPGAPPIGALHLVPAE